ncbi:MAG: pyridoxamine 5'-phosphate oxidase [Verrucomicrobiales bacterium]
MEKTDKPLSDLRVDYTRETLDKCDVAGDPISQFEKWFAEACAARLAEPNAMILATADASGRPSTRTVLLKGIDARGFSFFTNYESQKAAEIAAQSSVAATILWLELQRQVNIRGRTERTSRDESEAYFRLRPYRSQIAAHASQQSAVIPSRGWLENRFEELTRQFPEGQVPLPKNWGGYRIIPEAVEFWQGRPSRLHDRLRYVREDSAWRIERLSP